jgi:hypothetical protein
MAKMLWSRTIGCNTNKKKKENCLIERIIQ